MQRAKNIVMLTQHENQEREEVRDIKREKKYVKMLILVHSTKECYKVYK